MASKRNTQSGGRARRWAITIFGATLEDVKSKLELCEYARACQYQLETAPSTGQVHVQAYLECSKAVSLATVRTLFEKSHCEICKGTQAHNIAYCSKSDTRVDGTTSQTWGTFSSQGSRSDLSEVAVLVSEGANAKRVFEESPTVFIKYHKGIERAIALQVEPRDFKTRVIILYGEPGSGKTQWCRDYSRKECEEFSILSIPQDKSQWFDGAYEGNVLVDEFYGWIKWSLILQMMDCYPLKVPIKGGMVDWRVRTLFITSNVSPTKWYEYGDKMPEEAFRRRVEEVYKLDKADNWVPRRVSWLGRI